MDVRAKSQEVILRMDCEGGMMDIHAAIKNYEDALRDQLEMRNIYAAQRAVILSKVQGELNELETEMAPYLQGYADQVQKYEEEARRLVLELGHTVDGETSQFVYSKGKTTWDGQKLQGMAALIPQLAEAKRIGEPSVSIRSKK